MSYDAVLRGSQPTVRVCLNPLTLVILVAVNALICMYAWWGIVLAVSIHLSYLDHIRMASDSLHKKARLLRLLSAI